MKETTGEKANEVSFLLFVKNRAKTCQEKSVKILSVITGTSDFF
jgi:hypothetical protein